MKRKMKFNYTYFNRKWSGTVVLNKSWILLCSTYVVYERLGKQQNY